MKRIWIFGLAIVLLLSACGAERGIEVHEVWMRPVAQGENGAVYFVIHNHSSTTDEIVGVTAEIARAAEIHESRMNGDVMEMHRLESVPLEASAEVEFAPGGLHIMLVDVREDLRLGDEIEITLHFDSFEDISVLVPVQDAPAPHEDHSSNSH